MSPDPLACAATVCVPASGVGEPCGGQCAPGLTCSSDGVCITDTGRQGAACNPGALTPCDWTFSCRPNARGGGTCLEARTGDRCQGDLECPVEDFCDGTCRARLPLGAPCLGNPEGCVPLAVCDTSTGQCVPAGAAGEDCGQNGFCIEGACTTLITPSVCLARQTLGSPCDDPGQCTSGVCHNSVCIDCPR